MRVPTADLMAPFAAMALRSVAREFPYHLVHLVSGDADVRPPRELYPAFHGAFDWHSSVHGHWCLARLARCLPDAPFATDARRVLAASLTREKLAGELDYLAAKGREGFERPYGLAWLLQLAAELREWQDAEAGEWAAALAPLESLVAERLRTWLPRLPWPDRSGQHGQTAFALGLALDWARLADDTALAGSIERRARTFYRDDVMAPIAYEPSGHDFLSPALAEADLMRRVLPRGEFELWFARLLPDLHGGAAKRWLTPVASPDPADGKLAHLDGLNLSRAWMLEGVAASLPASEPRRSVLAAAARHHRDVGVASVTGEHYAGAHWLGSFVVYLETARGLEHPSPA